MTHRVVTCVPWRGGKAEREELWRIVRPHLEGLGWPIFTGDREGPWSRAAACNAAAAAAGEWDVALFADADTIPEPDTVMQAVERVVEHGGAIRPHDHLWTLSAGEMRLFRMRGEINFQPRRTNPGGGLLVITRRAFDAVGGFDERFVGWGHEDSHMATMLLVEADWDRLPGNAWHLYHERDSADTPERRTNRAMMHRVQREHRAEIEAASRARGYDVGAIL
jgi:hypothetical protein